MWDRVSRLHAGSGRCHADLTASSLHGTASTTAVEAHSHLQRGQPAHELAAGGALTANIGAHAHRLLFSYEVLTPAALNFFVTYADGAVESLWSIAQYFEFVLVLMLSTGLAFQACSPGCIAASGPAFRQM